jgi:hypothetical protein
MQEPTVQQLTIEILKNLKSKGLIIQLNSREDFIYFLNSKIAILYLLVEWSGTERMSRYFVYKLFDELNIKFYMIDCSEQNQEYIETWLKEQKVTNKDFYYGGNGETLLVSNGSIIDYIRYPMAIGLDKLELKIREWSINHINLD